MISAIFKNMADAIDALGLYAKVVYGSDPPENGICMIPGAGFPSERHLNTGMVYRLPVIINGKNSSLETVVGALDAIHVALTKTNNYTNLSTDDLQVVAVTTTAGPTIIGREQNNQWICGSSVEVSFYWR